MELTFLYENTPFPSVEKAVEGIVAFGGNLTCKRLLEAYRKGIFPWYSDEDPILWWSPDPRFVLFPKELHVSKNMRKLLKKKPYKVTYNQHFKEIITQCASISRKGQDSTWIHPEIIEAYIELHHQGFAYSVEVWENEELVGGLYGIKLNGIFCGESMFSKRNNASQYGFIVFLQEHPEIELVDCQIHSEYLEKMGAKEISRATFLDILSKLIERP